MKIIHFISLMTLCLISSTAYTQSLFIPKSFNTSSYEEADAVIEIPHNRYLFTAGRAKPDSMDAFLFVSDMQGNIVRARSLFANKDSGNRYAIASFVNNDQTISVFGIEDVDTGKRTNIWHARVDTLLNVLSIKTYTPMPEAGIRKCYFAKAGNSIIAVAEKGDEVQLIKLTEGGDTISTHIIDSNFLGSAWRYYHSYLTSVNSSVSGNDVYITAGTSIIKVDSNLRLLDTVDILNDIKFFSGSYPDTILSPFSEAIEISDGCVVVGARQFIAPSHTTASKETIGITKYSMKSHAFSSCTIPTPKNGFFECQRARSGSLITGYGNIYSLCTVDSYTDPNRVVVVAYDSSVKVKWVSYFGGDTYYYPTHIYATKDGGLIVLATRYELAPIFTSDYYILKLDTATGYPTSIVNVSEQLRSGILAYPNPTQGILKFHIMEQTKTIKGTLSISDVTGKQVLYQYLALAADYSIDVSALQAGTYIYEITDIESSRHSSGKFIKQ